MKWWKKRVSCDKERERWREGMKISHVCTYVLMLCGGEGEVGEGGIEKGGGGGMECSSIWNS